MSKVCARCGKDTPLTDYSKEKRNRDGLNSACRKCRSAAHKKTVARRRLADQMDPSKRTCSTCAKRRPVADFGGDFAKCLKCRERRKSGELTEKEFLVKADIEYLISCGTTPDGIAMQMGIQKRTLLSKMNRLGIPVPRDPFARGVPHSLGPKECAALIEKMNRWLFGRYHKRGYSIQQVARLEDLPYAQARKMAKSLGIAFRDEREEQAA